MARSSHLGSLVPTAWSVVVRYFALRCQDKYVWCFFDVYLHQPTFDMASDAFATLRDLLTTHKAIAKNFLDENYDKALPLAAARLVPSRILDACSRPRHSEHVHSQVFGTDEKPLESSCYWRLLQSTNYVTRRQSLKLLGVN